MENETITINWEPQPRQLVALKACGLDSPFTGNDPRPAIADVLGYGGSAGGGKTDTLLSVGITAAFMYPKINIGYFRREFPQLEGPGGAILRSQELISHVAKYNEQKHRWKFPDNSLMQFCHCSNPKDVYNYQSQQFDILLIDESTQFTEEMIDYLVTRNRATISNPNFKPFTLLATNPGGIGHGSFRARFVAISAPETLQDFVYPTGVVRKHYFIPSKLSDNKILEKRDPGYRDRIATNEMNRKMLLDGEWDSFTGQAFSELRREIHLITPFEIPTTWMKFGAYDHGFNHPFSFGVFAVDPDSNVYLARHASSRLKRPDEIARVIDSVSGGVSTLQYIVAGLDCWSRQRDGGPSLYETFLSGNPKINLRQANVDRIHGAFQVRQFIAWKALKEDKDGKPIDGKPKFFIFQNCSAVYDTVASMIFDDHSPEDVLKVDADENGQGGDDNYDMVRYGLMSRPKPLSQKEIPAQPNSFQSFLRKKEEERMAREEGYVGN